MEVPFSIAFSFIIRQGLSVNSDNLCLDAIDISSVLSYLGYAGLFT